jgi:energy-coupling factor transporter ATP-binding protein EcfA2
MAIDAQIKTDAEGGSLPALIAWTKSLLQTGDPKLDEKAAALFKAAEKAEEKILCAIGMACMAGAPPFAKDVVVGRLWLRQAESAGSGLGAELLGDLYFTEGDHKAAVNLYSTALHRGSDSADIKYALMRICGLGLPRSIARAIDDLRNAAANNAEAAALLADGIVIPEIARVFLGNAYKEGITMTVPDIEEHFTKGRISAAWFKEAPQKKAPHAPPPKGAAQGSDAPAQPTPQTVPPQAAAPVHEAQPDPFAVLDNLVGLAKVKKAMKNLSSQMKFFTKRKAAGLPYEKPATHFVFTGNPGTGKTTVARILGGIMKSSGYLEKGHVVECSARDLIGEWVGTTAPKVARQVEAAIGGVLFIDEAYSLLNAVGARASFTDEAISTLLKLMEDRRHEFVVVAAGYPDEMLAFVNANPGLKSRFSEFVVFDDYGGEDLEKIYLRMAERMQYQLQDPAKTLLKTVMAEAPAAFAGEFSNGRFVRNLFEDTIKYMAGRLERLDSGHATPDAPPGIEELSLIHLEDVQAAWDEAKSTPRETRTASSPPV